MFRLGMRAFVGEGRRRGIEIVDFILVLVFFFEEEEEVLVLVEEEGLRMVGRPAREA